jgi:hypothetical protein
MSFNLGPGPTASAGSLSTKLDILQKLVTGTDAGMSLWERINLDPAAIPWVLAVCAAIAVALWAPHRRHYVVGAGFTAFMIGVAFQNMTPPNNGGSTPGARGCVQVSQTYSVLRVGVNEALCVGSTRVARLQNVTHNGMFYADISLVLAQGGIARCRTDSTCEVAELGRVRFERQTEAERRAGTIRIVMV